MLRKKISISVNADSLLQVGKEIGIEFVNGNSSIVNQLVDLNNSRSRISEVECKVNGCGSSLDPGLEM